MDNLKILLTQINHLEEYAQIINVIDPIQQWSWGYNFQLAAIELHLACEKEMHTITMPNIKSYNKKEKRR